MKSIMVAGTNSGVGKTTVTQALLSLLPNPKAFKIGPDFIDPTYHRYITKKDVHNLDLFCYKDEVVQYLFDTFKEDINVLEGVMGLFAGLNHSRDNYSTAHISRVLNTKILLVVDGEHKDTSIQAEVLGYMKLDPTIQIAGVLLNNVTEGMYHYLSDALKEIDVKTYGYIPPLDFKIKERHLGLLQAQEVKDLDINIEKLRDVCKKTIMIDEIQRDFTHDFHYDSTDYFETLSGTLSHIKVAYTEDEAFSFMYDTHIEMLKRSGAELIKFSPLHDERLPEADLYIFTGGYPELHLEQLMKNHSMIQSIKKTTKKIYAECGGYIYLSKGIYIEDEFYEMVGLHQDTIQMTKKLDIKHFGYLDIETSDGFNIRGHEFHYSKLHKSNETKRYYNVKNKGYSTGVKKDNFLVGYPHILWFSNINYFIHLLGGEEL